MGGRLQGEVDAERLSELFWTGDVQSKVDSSKCSLQREEKVFKRRM